MGERRCSAQERHRLVLHCIHVTEESGANISPWSSPRVRNPVFISQKSLQLWWQALAQLLPSEHLTASPQFRSLYASHHCVPGLNQIRTAGVNEDTER